MKNDFTQEIICDKLFNIVEKPKNTVMCKANPIGTNKYRINVYTEHDIENLTYRKISYSCAARIENDELIILDQTPSYRVSV